MPEAQQDAVKKLKSNKEKAIEKEVEAMEKIFDKEDEMFCGFCAFNVIDQDGYSKMIKGCNVEGALFVERAGGNVVISASFTPKPHGYLSIQSDQELYINGSLWYGAEKKSPTNLIGRIIPKKMEVIKNEMDKGNGSTFEARVEMPFLKGAAKRLQKITFETVEERFLTKVSGLKIELSEADWTEWKNYKVRFWRLGKAAGASTEGGGDDEDKKDEKKE